MQPPPADSTRGQGGGSGPLLATVVAVSIGILVLLDMATDLPFLNALGALLVEYGLIIAAFALLLGLLNVLSVHSRKVRLREEGWPYSTILIVTTVILVVLGLLTGPNGGAIAWALNNVLLPLQAAFFSLLAFFLVSIAYRALRVTSFESLLLVGSAVLVILGATPIGALLGPFFLNLREGLLAIPAMAGARGLLLGIALGTIITGLRLIFDGRRYFR